MEKQQKKVIYFEDEHDMVELVRLILGREGYNVEGAFEGKSGLASVKEKLPDIVLLDLMMPDMDGWEIFKELKNDELTEDIPVVVITAKTQSVDKVLGIEIAQVDDYISKPFSPSELIERVERIVLKAEFGEKNK
jgi:two-component system response regulator VicR